VRETFCRKREGARKGREITIVWAIRRDGKSITKKEGKVIKAGKSTETRDRRDFPRHL
jgi:hypothetical protein